MVTDSMMVVQLAIDDGMDGSIGITERLLTSWTKTIDGQPAAAKAYNGA